MLRLVVDDPDVLFEEYKDRDVFHEGTQLCVTSCCDTEAPRFEWTHRLEVRR